MMRTMTMTMIMIMMIMTTIMIMITHDHDDHDHDDDENENENETISDDEYWRNNWGPLPLVFIYPWVSSLNLDDYCRII